MNQKEHEPLALKQRVHYPELQEANSFRPIGKRIKAAMSEARDAETEEELLDFIARYSELFDMIEDKTLIKGAGYLTNTSSARATLAVASYALRVTLPAFRARGKVIKLIASHPRRELLSRDHERLLRLADSIVSNKSSLLKTAAEYLKVLGYSNKIAKARVELDEKRLSLSRAYGLLTDPDRDLRERAWRSMYGYLAGHQQWYQAKFDSLLAARWKKARANGFDNPRDYFHVAAKKRFDYTPDDCMAFHDAIEHEVLPLLKKLDEKRREMLDVEHLRPWDSLVEPGGKRLVPYSDTGDLLSKMEAMLGRVKPEYGELFGRMQASGFIDPENRKGKVQGAMSLPLADHQAGFIIANTVGVDYDVFTMAHEAGHAVHWSAATKVPVSFYHELLLFPMELAELGSMGMESLVMDDLDVFYEDPDAMARARLLHLEKVARYLPWYAIVDAFQHWIYTHEGHIPAERNAHFLALLKRFSTRGEESSEGLERELESSWIRQSHVFQSPFYYIEYGLAQVGALGIYKNLVNDKVKAIQQYDDFLHLGNSTSLQEAYATAGVEFKFDRDHLRELMAFIGRQLFP